MPNQIEGNRVKVANHFWKFLVITPRISFTADNIGARLRFIHDEEMLSLTSAPEGFTNYTCFSLFSHSQKFPKIQFFCVQQHICQPESVQMHRKWKQLYCISACQSGVVREIG